MSRSMTAVLVIAATSIRRVTRDRSALFFMVVFPLGVVLMIGLAMGSVFGADGEPVGIVNPSRGPLAAELERELHAAKGVELVRFGDTESLRKAVRRQAVAAGVVVPAGYDDAVRDGRPVRVGLVEDPARPGRFDVRVSLEAALAAHASRAGAAAFATNRVGGDFDTNLAVASGIAGQDGAPTVTLETLGSGTETRLPLGFRYTAPANLVLFVFINSIAFSAMLIETRRRGIWSRILATPTPAWAVVTGETLGRFTIALGQSLIIVAAGRLVFGVHWGDPLGAAALVVVFSLVSVAAAMLAATLLATTEQAGTIGPAAGIALGMLGGSMWPLEIVPPAMRVVGHAFPHAWAMDGFIALIARGESLGQILPNLAALAAFAAVLLPLAVVRLRRAVVA